MRSFKEMIASLEAFQWRAEHAESEWEHTKAAEDAADQYYAIAKAYPAELAEWEEEQEARSCRKNLSSWG